MADRMTYTDEQKAEALRLHVEVGPTRASEQLGIPKNTIATWGFRAGLKSIAAETTRAAVEAHTAMAHLRRAELAEEMLRQAAVVAARISEPYEEYVGVEGKKVHYEQPPAAATHKLAETVRSLVTTLRLEKGEATSRSEVSVDDRRAALAARADELADRRSRRAAKAV